MGHYVNSANCRTAEGDFPSIPPPYMGGVANIAPEGAQSPRYKKLRQISFLLFDGALRQALAIGSGKAEQALGLLEQKFGLAERIETNVLPAHQARAIDQERAVQR